MKRNKRLQVFLVAFALAAASVAAYAKPRVWLCDYGTVGESLCIRYGGIFCDIFCV